MWVLIGSLAFLGIIAALFGYISNRKGESQIIIAPSTANCATCSGSNPKCEQECVMEAATKEIEYFDDEELDQSVTIKDDDTLSIGVFDNCPKLTVVWDAEDASYDFYNIKALEMNVGECPTLYECNNDPEAKLEIVDIG